MTDKAKIRYRMPAEWEKHEGTWIAWPHNKSHWPGKFEPIPLIYAELVRALSMGEKVFICVNDDVMERSAREILEAAGLRREFLANVQFFVIPTDASWSRDHGPIFVREVRDVRDAHDVRDVRDAHDVRDVRDVRDAHDARDPQGKLVIEDWIFNAWGQKYAPWDQDDVVPQKIAKILKLAVIEPGMVLEGGSIDVNGKGSLLTTEQCLLNKNRNMQMGRAEISARLAEFLGATNVLWLKEGIIGDDTDGHIDDIARFTDARTIVCALEENGEDENYEILQRNFEILKKMRDQDGAAFKIVPIPMPDPVIHEGQRLPASYANFYISNAAVVVPTFRCGKDKKVLQIFGELFRGRKIVGIDCVDWVWGLGTLHCSTQQQPV